MALERLRERDEMDKRWQAFPLLSLRFHYAVLSAGEPLDNLGGEWRGALGPVLKDAACIMAQGTPCAPCALRRGCLYARLYEPAQGDRAHEVPRPFTVSTNTDSHLSPSDDVHIDLCVFGNLTQAVPSLIHSAKALAHRGIGGTKSHAKMTLTGVAYAKTPGGEWYPAENVPIDEFARAAANIMVPPAPESCRAWLQTPLQLRQQKRLLKPTDFDFDVFLGRLRFRLRMLSRYFGGSGAEAWTSQHETMEIRCETHLGWTKGRLRSRRREWTDDMSGLTGSMVLSGPSLKEIWPMLWIGQWTQVGGNVARGLGRYRLEWSTTSPRHT